MPLFPALGRPVLWTQGVHKTTKQTVSLVAGVWARSQSHSLMWQWAPQPVPHLWCRLWGGQTASTGSPALQVTAWLECLGKPGDHVRCLTRALELPPQLLFLVVYRIKDSCRKRSESFPRWGTSGYCSCSLGLARKKVMFPSFSFNPTPQGEPSNRVGTPVLGRKSVWMSVWPCGKKGV